MVCACIITNFESVFHPGVTQFRHFIRSSGRTSSLGTVAPPGEWHYNYKDNKNIAKVLSNGSNLQKINVLLI